MKHLFITILLFFTLPLLNNLVSITQVFEVRAEFPANTPAKPPLPHTRTISGSEITYNFYTMWYTTQNVDSQYRGLYVRYSEKNCDYSSLTRNASGSTQYLSMILPSASSTATQSRACITGNIVYGEAPNQEPNRYSYAKYDYDTQTWTQNITTPTNSNKIQDNQDITTNLKTNFTIIHPNEVYDWTTKYNNLGLMQENEIILFRNATPHFEESTDENIPFPHPLYGQEPYNTTQYNNVCSFRNKNTNQYTVVYSNQTLNLYHESTYQGENYRIRPVTPTSSNTLYYFPNMQSKKWEHIENGHSKNTTIQSKSGTIWCNVNLSVYKKNSNGVYELEQSDYIKAGYTGTLPNQSQNAYFENNTGDTLVDCEVYSSFEKMTCEFNNFVKSATIGITQTFKDLFIPKENDIQFALNDLKQTVELKLGTSNLNLLDDLTNINTTPEPISFNWYGANLKLLDLSYLSLSNSENPPIINTIRYITGGILGVYILIYNIRKWNEFFGHRTTMQYIGEDGK